MFSLVVDEEYRQDVFDSMYEFFHNKRDKCYHVMLPEVPTQILELPLDELAEFYGFQSEGVIAGELLS